MNFVVTREGISPIGSIGVIIPFEIFTHLSGLRFRFDKRIDQQIYIERINGHLYIRDTKFIVGEFYKKDGKTYYCNHLTDNLALLENICSMKIITSDNPLEFTLTSREISKA